MATWHPWPCRVSLPMPENNRPTRFDPYHTMFTQHVVAVKSVFGLRRDLVNRDPLVTG